MNSYLKYTNFKKEISTLIYEYIKVKIIVIYKIIKYLFMNY